MSLLLLIAIGGAGAATSAWGLGRGGRASRTGAVVGGLALFAVLLLALTLDATRIGDGALGGVEPGTVTDLREAGILDGHLVANDYLRLVVGLWALDAALVVGIAWLMGGLAGLRGLLPATLAAITGGAIAFAATDLTLGAAAAGATGLSALLVVLAVGTVVAVAPATRELRVSVAGSAVLIAVAAAAPVVAGLVLRSPGAFEGGEGSPTAPTEAGALIGLLLLAIALAVAVRLGSIPFHLRVPRLSDVVPPISLPLLLAWIPVPLAVVGLAIADLQLAPLALPLEGEHWILVALALLTLAAAALAAFIQDDLRHATGYLIVADGALVLLGFAALDPAVWGPARVWLVVLAASKTALAAWAAVAEQRFDTRSIPDLRGWLRRAPMLGAGLAITTVATFGLPGWVALTARVDLARLSAGSPWDAVLLLAGLATLPTYLRLLGLGTGPATSRVRRAAPERITRSQRAERLPVIVEGQATAAGAGTTVSTTATSARRRAAARGSAGAAALGRRFATALRRDSTELISAAVLALAILAALASWGALDLAGAASEPAPIVAGPASD